MVVTIWAGDLITGALTIPLPVSAGSWSIDHRSEGSVSATMTLSPEILRRFPGLVGKLDPWRCFLAAITDDSQVLEAGPILPHKYSDATGVLQVSALGMRGIFARRLLISDPSRWPGGKPAEAVMSWSGVSLGTIAKRIVALAMSHDGGSLPIDLPPDEVGTATRTYYGFELARISKRLKELEDVENGPDLRFDPYLTSEGRLDRVRWQMKAGTTAAPELAQDGPDHEWDRNAVHGPVVSLDVDTDSSEMGDRAWVTGQGSDTQLLMSMYQDRGLRAAGYPLLEVDESRPSVSRQSTLNAHTRALHRRSARPWQTWKLVVRADAGPKFGTYRPGHWARIHVGSHPYIKTRTGYYRTRILSVSGGLDGNVTLVLAPQLEDR